MQGTLGLSGHRTASSCILALCKSEINSKIGRWGEKRRSLFIQSLKKGPITYFTIGLILAYLWCKTPGKGSHILRQTGMCRSNGSLFYKKSLNMGPVFYKKNLKHGSNFLTEPNFSGFRQRHTPVQTKSEYLPQLPLGKNIRNGYILKRATTLCD